MPPLRLRLLAATALMLVALRPESAAATALLRFSLPPQSLTEALLSVAQRGGVALRLEADCHRTAVGLQGVMTVRAAVETMLEGSDCRSVWISEIAVRIVRRSAMPAQSPARIESPPAANAVDTVIVTAEKRALSSIDVAGSTTIISAAQLSAMDGYDTRDLGFLASGMTITNLGPGRDKVLLRGLSDGAFTGHTQSTVGIYWNEAPITYNAPDPDLRLVDIDSVEVLRGPQGTLYGGGALGGVLSIQPRKPDPHAPSAQFDASAADTASGAPGATMDGMVNLPLAGVGGAFRLVAYGEEDGGYIREPLQMRSDVNGEQRLGVRAALALPLAPGWTATLGDTYQDLYNADAQYTTQASGLSRNTLIAEPTDNDFNHLYLDVEGDSPVGRIRSVSSLINHDFTAQYDASAALSQFGGSAGQAGRYDDDTHVELLSQEFNFRPSQLGRISLLLGAYAGYGFITETTRLAQNEASTLLYAEHRTDELVDFAAFGEASYHLTQRLEITLGLRAFNSTRRTLSANTEGSALASFQGKLAMHDVAPKVALDYQLVPRWRVYGLISQGYRVGGFNTAGPSGQVFGASDALQPARTYLPDQLWNFEFGAKGETSDHRVGVQTSVYYDSWNRLQADQFLASGLPYVANVGDARIYGWEWELSLRPVDAVTVQFSGLLTVPNLHDADPGFTAGQSDFTLPGVARRTFNGEVQYVLPLSLDRSLSLAGAAEYVGHSYLFFGPETSARMGDYIDVRLEALYHTAFADLGLSIDNPANRRGNTFAYGNPFTLTTEQQTTPLRPRQIGLRVRRAF